MSSAADGATVGRAAARRRRPLPGPPAMGTWDDHHPDAEHVRHEGSRDLVVSRWELAFWVLVILAHIGVMVYAARRLAVRYTDSTGGVLVVPDQAEATLSTGTASAATRKRVGKGSDLPE